MVDLCKYDGFGGGEVIIVVDKLHLVTPFFFSINTFPLLATTIYFRTWLIYFSKPYQSAFISLGFDGWSMYDIHGVIHALILFTHCWDLGCLFISLTVKMT